MNETDRELLEWAFKAYRPGENYIRMVNDAGYDWWNPLKDSGQALELAVKLRLKVELKTNHLYVIDDESGLVIAEDYSDNLLTATRRAIVRAAAEIGKAMA